MWDVVGRINKQYVIWHVQGLKSYKTTTRKTMKLHCIYEVGQYLIGFFNKYK